jgi:hypothetical protein
MIITNTTVLDMGTINQKDGKWTGKVTLTNQSDKAIHNIRATASCGCTKPILASTIEAMSSEEMIVGFNPEGRSGTQLKTLTVVVPGYDDIKIKLQGNVVK